MSGEKALSEAFLSGASSRNVAALRAAPGLEETLQALLAQARQAHPTLSFQPEAFLRHLAARLPSGGDLQAALKDLRADELLLAFACAQGHADAIATLERQLISQVGAWFPNEDAAFQAELRQQLRQRLLLAQDGAPPKIATFSGRGTLTRWVRAIAARLVIDLKREAPRHVPLEELPSETNALVGPHPEFSFIRGRYQHAFIQAFQEALAALTPRERNLLRLHHVDNLSVESVSVMYQASRSTAARWIVQAREQLIERTRAALAARLQLEPEELQSLLGMLRSQLEVSLHRLLQP